MTDNPASGLAWDLSDLYVSCDDPRIQTDLAQAESKSSLFEKTYKEPLSRLKAGEAFPLAALLEDYKQIICLLTKPGIFAFLLFAQKTDEPSRGAFLQKIRTRATDIQAHLLFFEVFWNRLEDKTVHGLLADARLERDRHFLEKLRSFSPHTLLENEEKILSLKSLTGGEAFARLFDEVLHQITYELATPEGPVKKTEQEVLTLLHSPERSERKMASESLAEGLSKHTHALTYVFNMILADHRTSAKIRHYAHPMDAMNLSNEISLESVKNLMKAVKSAYPLAARYYRLKKKWLGLEHFRDYDRYAPVGAKRAQISFDQAKKIVLEGYHEFSPRAAEILEPFFTKRWIDAELRPGKQGGAFSCQTTPDLHPYVLVNYAGTLRDVSTLAHELGHGLHQWLSRPAGVFESHAPLTLAETASVFGEMLIFEKLFAGQSDPLERRSLLCGEIDDHFATVFRQIVLTDFELAIHTASAEEGELPHERISDLWMKCNREFYGDGVELTPAYRHGWKYISHFIHLPFYCYAYAFAQLFVLCLYEKYKEDKARFVPAYFEMLSLGGSKKPLELGQLMGLDTEHPAFWQKGLCLLEKLVDTAEKI